MAGAGNYNALSDADKARIKAVSSCVLLSRNGEAPIPLTYTISKGHLKKNGYAESFGPEMFIGVTLAEANPEQEYLFIKYSMGGTSLYGAWNPEWTQEKAQAVEKGEAKQARKLYSEHIAAIKENLTALEKAGKSYEIIGMVWMQGENDAAREISARSYEANLTTLIASYRAEFNVPEMPVVCGQINSAYGSFPEGPDMVRTAFVDVADSDPNVAVIRTMKERPPMDFPKVDGAHYNQEGQKRLGTAMGQALLCMVTVPEPSPEEVKVLTQKVADWQIETFDEAWKYRAITKGRIEQRKKAGTLQDNWPDLAWHNGALYAGMVHWCAIADNPAKYTDWLKMIGVRNEWTLYTNRPYHADDHTVGQFYTSMYQEFKDPAMLKALQSHFDWILAHPKTGSLITGKGTKSHDRWGWCDALFMAPPAWARLAKITGDRIYLNFMDQEYHTSYDLLWNTEARLFSRDFKNFTKFEKNGKKLFWARGNGWVFGGLALMIPELPTDWEGRPFYINLFQEMAASLKNCQRPDGTWSMGLLGDIESYPSKDTSGTAFFTFGLAWGINNGILDRATYEPVALHGWQALTECITPEGFLGYVQATGIGPGKTFPDKTEVYGIGAFLAAGTEVYKLVGGK